METNLEQLGRVAQELWKSICEEDASARGQILLRTVQCQCCGEEQRVGEGFLMGDARPVVFAKTCPHCHHVMFNLAIGDRGLVVQVGDGRTGGKS
jgi:hypothetical protein